MISIIDYDAGNIKSVEKAMEYLGQEVIITRDKDIIMSSDKVILPGVGCFKDAMDKIREYKLDNVIFDVCDSGKPFLGICLGLQLLYKTSEESPGATGLGILDGEIIRIPDAPGLKIPQIGWNSLDIKKDSSLFKYINQGDFVYFVHSYFATNCNDSLLAITDYGIPLTAAVAKDNIYGCQFHPEKSGNVGLKILKGFVDL